MNQKRSDIIRRYLSSLSGSSGIQPLLPYEPETYSYQMFGIRTDEKDKLIIYLKSKGIATGCHYTPLTMQPLFKTFLSPCPIIETEYHKMITLPLHADLTDTEVDYIIDNIRTF